MRIGIDARPLQGPTRYRGIGKALENVLDCLNGDAYHKHHFVFYLDAYYPVPAAVEQFQNSSRIFISSNRLGRLRYLRSILTTFKPARPQPRDVDVFLQYDAALGVPTSVPCVVVFHDLIPYLFRKEERAQKTSGISKYKGMLASRLYWRKYLWALGQYKRARHVIAISDASKKDFIHHLGRQPNQPIETVYHGIASTRHSASPSANAISLASRPFLLYVGGIDIRKNIVGLLQSYYQVKSIHPDLRLLMIGKEFELTARLRDQGWFEVLDTNPDFAHDVLLPGFVDDDDLWYLYGQARALVFPSRYEGFGLPILEAMRAGCPVIAYNNSSLPEVGRNAAYFVKDGDSLTPAINDILDDDALRQRLIMRGKTQVRKFSWETTASKTMHILLAAAEGRHNE